jgi:hypothetical protein
MLAFHEAFADIVALFQHFTMPEALLHQIKQSGGDLTKGGPLGELAQQFGKASGMHGALRSFMAKPSRTTTRSTATRVSPMRWARFSTRRSSRRST